MLFGTGAAEQPANAWEVRRPEIATHRRKGVVTKNNASRIPFLNGAWNVPTAFTFVGCVEFGERL
jgi:hypothetical protein